MSTAVQTAAQNTTLANLQTAYNGESNACVRYGAFAARAEAEGYHQAASLFRAASRAEQIHAGNHAKTIRAMGGQPLASIEMPDIKSTAVNLKAAIAGEEYERDVMYPDFIRQAEAQKDAAAVRTFHGALAAEVEHAMLYKAALANLKPSAQKATYYVCPVCGYTVEKLAFDKCPVCKVPGETFEVIQ